MPRRPNGMTVAELLVDAHVHLGPPKYASAEEFVQAMAAERIDAAVLVQHLGNVDNDYLASVRASRPKRFAAIGIIERSAHLDGVLEAGFAGLRLPPTGLPVPDGAAIFDALAERHAIASITGPVEDVTAPAFRAVVRSHPDLLFRIEHVGGFRYGRSRTDDDRFRALLALADAPNVTLMWSGFFLNAGTPFPYPNVHAHLVETLRAFGSERIMWSGDWNRADRAADDYRRAVDLVRLVAQADDQIADILGRTACRVFGIAAAEGLNV